MGPNQPLAAPVEVISESFPHLHYLALGGGGPSFSKSEELNPFWNPERLKNPMTALVLLPRKTLDIGASKISPTVPVGVCVCGVGWAGVPEFPSPRTRGSPIKTVAREYLSEGWRSCGATFSLPSSSPPLPSPSDYPFRNPS